MKAPLKMYVLKPVVDQNFAIEIPKCMYALKNIHRPRKVDGSIGHVPSPVKKLDIFDQVKQFLKNCQEVPGMAELEAKQTEILEQLALLKKQIFSLKRDLNIQNDSSSKGIVSTTQFQAPAINKKSLPDSVVISANPSSPPYSLELLQRLLQNQVGLVVTSYLHSTIASLPNEASQLRESLISFKPPTGVPVINIRLIWKNITSNAEFLISHVPVTGEVNFLRYVSRLVTTSLSYSSEANSFETDSILDQCFLLVRAKTKTERAAILQTLNKSLGKSQWLVGRSQMGIADIAAYSSIKQCTATTEMSANLTKWYQRCATLISPQR